MTSDGRDGEPAALDDGAAATRGGVAIAAVQVVIRVLQLGFVLVVTRTVPGGEFGRYSIAAALLVLGGFVADAGTTQALVRLVSREPGRARALLSESLAASAALGALGWGAIVAIAALAYGPPHVVDAAIVGATLPITAVSTSIYGTFDGLGRLQHRSLISLVTPVIAIGAGAVAIVVLDDIRAGLWVMLGAAVAGGAVAWAAATRARLIGRLSPTKATLRTVFGAAGPIAVLTGLGTATAWFDILFLGGVSGAGAAASYDVALRSTEAVWAMHTVVTGPALFLLSHRFGRDDRAGAGRAYALAVRISYVVGGAAAVVAVALREEILRLLGAADYPDGAAAIAILGGALWLTLATLVQGSLMLAGASLRAAIRPAAIAAVVTVALDLAIIPSQGVVGAAWASVLAVGVTFVVFARFHSRHTGLATPFPHAAVVAATAGAVAASTWAGAPAALVALVGLAALAVATALTGAFTRGDVRAITASLRRSRPIAEVS